MAFDPLAILAIVRSSFPYWGAVSTVTFYGKIIGGFVSFVFLVGVVITIKKIVELSRKKARLAASADSVRALRAEELFQKQSKRAWEDILQKAHSDNSSDWLSAVIQADAIFDDILKRMGVHGETMGERLQKLDASKLTSLQDIWEAHKLRNRIAHTPSTMLRHDELLGAIAKYKKGLRELGYLE